MLKPGDRWPKWDPVADPGRKKVQKEEMLTRVAKMKANAERLQALLDRDALLEEQRQMERDRSPGRHSHDADDI